MEEKEKSLREKDRFEIAMIIWPAFAVKQQLQSAAIKVCGRKLSTNARTVCFKWLSGDFGRAMPIGAACLTEMILVSTGRKTGKLKYPCTTWFLCLESNQCLSVCPSKCYIFRTQIYVTRIISKDKKKKVGTISLKLCIKLNILVIYFVMIINSIQALKFSHIFPCHTSACLNLYRFFHCKKLRCPWIL